MFSCSMRVESFSSSQNDISRRNSSSSCVLWQAFLSQLDAEVLFPRSREGGETWGTHYLLFSIALNVISSASLLVSCFQSLNSVA